MHARKIFILLSLLTLTMAQGEDTCEAKVVMMGKGELAKEISAEIAKVLLPKIENCATYENIKAIVKEETEKFQKVEVSIKPIAEKPNYPASSCKEIIELEPKSPSGYYWLRASNGSAVRMFCDMTRTCGGVTGGWMKVAELDMTNTAQQCPSSLSALSPSGKRLCSREVDDAGCSSVNYPTQGIGYSEVCGKVIGYQFGSPDAAAGLVFKDKSIDGPYIDGVSLTHGSPKQHIWSFLAALSEDTEATVSTCYCTNKNNRGPLPPSFVGEDYFCDTGNRKWIGAHQFEDSPLWDGAGCGSTNECCTFNNPPWFYKSLAQGTSDDIEMRVCRDQGSGDEDVYIEKIDIFVR